jgi:hypothetical protein
MIEFLVRILRKHRRLRVHGCGCGPYKYQTVFEAFGIRVTCLMEKYEWERSEETPFIYIWDVYNGPGMSGCAFIRKKII